MATSSLPDVQKAWVQVGQGTPEQAMHLKTDWPVPQIASGNVLVRIQAAALNPADYKMLATMPNILANRPRVTGIDFAGYIIDPNGSEFKPGDAVFGYVPAMYSRSTKQGSLCEYAVVPSIDVARRPSSITIPEAAGITLTSLTALQALEEAGLEEGQTILINGASTSVGLYAVQIAKLKGAKVVGIASGKNEELVRRLGADEFVDYTQTGPIHTHFASNPPHTKFNVILEAVGMWDPSLYTYSKPYLAPNGVFMSVGPQPKMNLKSLWDGIRLASIWLPGFVTGFKPRYSIVLASSEGGRKLKEIHQWLQEGKLKPLVDSVYPFEEVVKAYGRLMTGRATGKVIVKVDPGVESDNGGQ